MTRVQVRDRLRDIFAAILGLAPHEVVAELSPDTCEAWDSLHHIHLVNAIQEAFGVALDIEQQVEILSFALSEVVTWEALQAAGRTAVHAEEAR